MNKTRIWTIIFTFTSICLFVFLVSRIKYKVDEGKRIIAVEAKVINKLKTIRKAQIVYQDLNGIYCNNWDSLISFVQNGIIPLINKQEVIVQLGYGADSSYWLIDTLGTISVMDSIYSGTEYANFDATKLPFIPTIDKECGADKFKLWADYIKKGNMNIPAVMVFDTNPYNKSRKEESIANYEKPLRFGSDEEITTSGNWRGED